MKTFTITAILALSCQAVTLSNTMEAAAAAQTSMEAAATTDAAATAHAATELMSLLDAEAMAGKTHEEMCKQLWDDVVMHNWHKA